MDGVIQGAPVIANGATKQKKDVRVRLAVVLVSAFNQSYSVVFLPVSQADYKPFAMTVLLAASCSFLTPIGTPTNIMVWAPGGYKFHHFAKLGAPLSAIFLLAAGTAIPWVFPF